MRCPSSGVCSVSDRYFASSSLSAALAGSVIGPPGSVSSAFLRKSRAWSGFFHLMYVRPSAKSAAASSVGSAGVIVLDDRCCMVQLGIRISPTWFVEMLNSIVLSDRTHATLALINLTDSRTAATLDLLRERALHSLVEMAQWNSLRYALPAYILLGRVGGLSEPQIQTSWTKGDRAAMVLQVVGSSSKKKRR